MHGPTRGIVLQSTPYRDHDRIVTLLTQDCGIVKIMVKRATSKRNGLGCLCSPLTLGEWMWNPGRGELNAYVEGKVLDTFPELRRNWEWIEVAGHLLKATLATQLPGTPLTELYALLITYLKMIPGAVSPRLLELSFTLKLAKHDGLLVWSPVCSHCRSPGSYWLDGVSYCSLHRQASAMEFSEKEWETISVLTNSRSMPELMGFEGDCGVKEKVERLVRRVR